MSEKKIGYARAATQEEIAVQIERLKEAGCTEIFSDMQQGGVPPFDRAGLQSAAKAWSAGDVLVVCELKRLARPVDQFVSALVRLKADGVSLLCLDDPMWRRVNGGDGRTQ